MRIEVQRIAEALNEGRRAGTIWGRRVEVFGGLILIAVGIDILISHLSKQ